MANLAPTVTGFKASNITASSFLADLTAVNPNDGGTLTNARCQYNTSASATGATIVTRGSYGDVTVTGLRGGTTYYFAMSIGNNSYGWGPWSGWQSFTTLPLDDGGGDGGDGEWIPYVTGFKASNITASTFLADITGATAGTGTLTDARCQYNTSASATGATVVTRGSYDDVTITGLRGGTTYYFAMSVASQSYGWGPWTTWKNFITLPDVSVKVGGVWKNATPYVKVGGAWKEADRWVKVNGVWVR